MEPTPNLNRTVLAGTGFPALPLVRRPGLPALGDLSVQVLRSAADRLLIAPLRQYADCGSEYELDPGMAALEKKKDALGMVMAILQDGEPIATLRLIPSGHGVTLTERYWGHLAAGAGILGPDSWEVGRLVMAPENRRADLLPRCLALALAEFVEQAEPLQFHASCLTRMTRLYRRFGFSMVGSSTSSGGKECALIQARVHEVARALKVPGQHQLPVLQ